ncbi:MAG TPA: sigma-70 family RNA polymerase sigma factor [Planctomycetota bacterium]|nr:sigma-70 family RNA polymerase sigma factor [Planctomycetota bacterium]
MRTPSPSSDQILVRIVAGTAGEADWQSLVERHGEAMRHASRLATGAESLMDDAVQEALLQLPRCAGRFQGNEGVAMELQVSRWLQRLTVNCALALRRADRRRHQRESLHAEMVMGDRGQAEDPRAEQLAQALAELNERERQVLLLRHVEKLNHHGLAAALGVNPAVARKRLSRAHELLRGRLAKLFCATSVLVLAAKLDAAGSASLSPAPTLLWIKAAVSGTTPTLATSTALIPGGMSAMSLTTLIAVPVLAASIAVGAGVAIASPTPPQHPPAEAGVPHVKGKTVTIGTGSGMLDYPTAQATLKLEPGDVLVIAPGTYLGLALGNLAGTAVAPITVTCDPKTIFTSPGGRSDAFSNLSFVTFEGFRIDHGSPWVFSGASHDLRFSRFVATKSFCFRPYDAAKVFNGTKDSAFYNFTWEDCSFGEEGAPFDGSAISSTDWQPVSNLKSVQLDFKISRCTFTNFDFGTSAGTVISMSKCFNLTVHDCTFSNIGYSKFIVGHDVVIGGSGYFKISNNIFLR